MGVVRVLLTEDWFTICMKLVPLNSGFDSRGGGLLSRGPYTSRLSCFLIGSNVRAREFQDNANSSTLTGPVLVEQFI